MIKTNFFLLKIYNSAAYTYNKVFTARLVKHNSLDCWNCKNVRIEKIDVGCRIAHYFFQRTSTIEKMFCAVKIFCTICKGYQFERNDWNRSYEHLGKL